MGYRNYEAWTKQEIDELFRLRSNGDTFAEICAKINRSAASAKSAFKRFKKIYPNCIPPKKNIPAERHRREKYSMCWLCQNACVNCEKPVKGWNAKKIKNDGNRIMYVVKKCPNYIPEPWVDKYDCTNYYQNTPKKVVKNGKTSRSET